MSAGFDVILKEHFMNRIAAAALAAVLAAPTLALAAPWALDGAHSKAGFKVRHMMVSWAEGQFKTVDAKIDYDEKKPQNLKIEATIDVASVDTNNDKRDEHLRSPDFFDVANHPKMTFKSTKVKVNKDGSMKVTGDLTMRGVTKSVTLDVEKIGIGTNPWGQKVLGTSATTKLNRKDFGVAWNQGLEAGGVLVGEEVQVSLNLEFNPVQAQAGK